MSTNGNPTPFPFDSEEDQAKLFSIMWDGDQDKESFFFTTCRTERALSTKESELILLASGEASRRPTTTINRSDRKAKQAV